MMAQQPPRVCYEIFIRSFCDSNRDGIGDLNGITSKLDYLQDLGIEGIWITPFFASPSYHKYDIVDYRSIDPDYGTMADFEHLLAEAHRRNIQVFLDFVINHTSSQHPWFMESKKGKENPYRNYYSWLTPERIDSLGIAVRERTADSWETQPWHWAKKGDDEKYYGMFWSGMPDLNMDEPRVRQEIYGIGKFWLDKGVDGFRMDAAKHIYPDWEADKAHAFWQEFRREMEAVKPDVYIVGEVWTSAEKAAPFFRGLKANFDFDLCFALQDVVKKGRDSVGIVQLLLKNYAAFQKENHAFIDATMLSNHDQNRIGSVAEGDSNKLKMAANLLLTLPGEPFIYYGEELGMKGVKPDEDIREAFLWDTRWQDSCRTNWRKPRYNTDSRTTPLSLQRNDPASLYNHYKTLIQLRLSQPALGQVTPPNLRESELNTPKIVSFVRPHQTGDLLVMQNVTATALKVSLPKYSEVIYGSVPPDAKGFSLPPYGLVILKL